MKKVIPLVLALCFMPIRAVPCSIFTWSADGATYFCGNEDWMFTDPVIASEPGEGGNYGYVAFGWKRYYPSYVQGGVNEKGLCFDYAVVPGQTYVPDPAKEEFQGDLLVHVMKRCANVEEALAMIGRYNFSLPASEHVVFADASGKSCVVEYNEKQLKIIRSPGKYLIATNYHLSNPSLGWAPCVRYEAIENRLKRIDRLRGIDYLRDTLDASHQEGQYPTIYSYIVDTAKMELHVYYNHDYSGKHTYSIRDMIGRKTLVDLQKTAGTKR